MAVAMHIHSLALLWAVDSSKPRSVHEEETDAKKQPTVDYVVSITYTVPHIYGLECLSVCVFLPCPRLSPLATKWNSPVKKEPAR